MKKLEGIVAAMVTPMFAGGRINFEETGKLVKHLFKKGLHGILVGGGTGEYNMMSMEERKELISCALEAAKGFDGYIIAGACCHGTHNTVELAKFAGDAGADFVLVLPPYYMPTTKQATLDYFKEVSQNTRAGLVIYHYPFGTNVELTPSELIGLGKEPNIAGVKNTHNMEHTMKMIVENAHSEKFKITTGLDTLILSTLACGGDGSITIAGNIFPAQFVQIYNHIKANDLRSAREIYEKIMPVLNLQLTPENPYPGPVKYCLELQGIPVGVPRKPVVTVDNDMKVKLKELMAKVGALE